MHNSGEGRRTFFRYPGNNVRLGADDMHLKGAGTRIFDLAYLTMRPALDAVDKEGRTAASRVVEHASATGHITVADLVSPNQPRVRDVVSSALHVDDMLLNELEARWSSAAIFPRRRHRMASAVRTSAWPPQPNSASTNLQRRNPLARATAAAPTIRSAFLV